MSFYGFEVLGEVGCCQSCHVMLAARLELLHSGTSCSSSCFQSDTKGLQITSFGCIFDPVVVSILTSTLLPTKVGRLGKTMQ